MNFLLAHRTPILVALFVGCVAAAPSVLAPIIIGDEYRGVQFLQLNDEDLYRARIHDVLDGHPLLSSPYLYEYKDSSPVVVPPVNDWFYAYPAYVFGLSGIIAVSKFLLPAILFLLAYLLTRRIVGDGPATELTALSAGLAVVLGADMVDYAQLFAALAGASPPHPLLWTRLVNPIMGGVQLFAFLIFLWDVWDRRWRFAYVAAGAVLSTMIGYFFSFGMALAILGAIGVFALLRKEYGTALQCLGVIFVSAVLDFWWLYQAFISMGGPDGQTRAERNGMFLTHAPHLNKALLAATAFVLASFLYAYVWKKRHDASRSWLFVWALIVGGWIVFNEQIITGKEVWYHHFVQYTVPVAIVACIIALFFLLRDTAPRLLIFLMITISVVSVGYGTLSATSFISRVPDLARLQGYAPLFEWFNANAQRDCVVLDGDYSEELTRLIPAYTACNVYISSSTFFGITPERIEHNFLLRMRLNGVRASDASEYLRAHEDEIRSSFFSDWSQLFGHGEEPWILDRIAALEKDYQAFVRGDLAEEIHSYRADYIVFQNTIPAALRRELPALTLATSTGGFHIYTF